MNKTAVTLESLDRKIDRLITLLDIRCNELGNKIALQDIRMDREKIFSDLEKKMRAHDIKSRSI